MQFVCAYMFATHFSLKQLLQHLVDLLHIQQVAPPCCKHNKPSPKAPTQLCGHKQQLNKLTQEVWMSKAEMHVGVVTYDSLFSAY
jgi:hypothetical protein